MALRVLAVAMPSDVLAEYESVVREAGSAGSGAAEYAGGAGGLDASADGAGSLVVNAGRGA